MFYIYFNVILEKHLTRNGFVNVHVYNSVCNFKVKENPTCMGLGTLLVILDPGLSEDVLFNHLYLSVGRSVVRGAPLNISETAN